MAAPAENVYANVKVENQFYEGVMSELPSLEGKVAVVTGTTSGTGYVLALSLAKKGAKVLMLNRKSSRADEAQEKMASQLGAAGSKVSTIDCDLQDFESVREACKKVVEAAGEDGIDLLGCNAGVMALPDKATKDGYDVQMQTNHLSHFLMAKELFPLLQVAAEKRGEARVVTMTSEARKGSPLEAMYLGKNGGNLGGDALGEGMFSGARWTRYHQTKLANCVFTYALHDRLQVKGSKVKAVLAHPGLSATNLQATTHETGGMPDNFGDMFAQAAMSPEDGACPMLLGLAQPAVESGDFFGPKPNEQGRCWNGAPVKVPPEDLLKEESSKKMLWEESEKAVGGFAL